ncbi:aromatic compound dioxygenase, partial [Dendrothele bispora CBS 962.96]
RGLQETDEDGVIQFLSIFPGHYTGRAIHIHLAAHQDGTFFSNNTFVSSNVSHVGQIFFDQSLIDAVEATSPYTSNTQNLTVNSDDDILAEEAGTIDPFVEYVYLGDDISDGIFSWIALGIDTTSSYQISAASTLTEDGGVAN